MKKFFSLLLVLPLLAVMASCDDDDNGKNIPDVSLSIEYSGGSLSDGVLYVVQGQTLDIDALTVTPAPGTGKAVLGNTTYFFDGYPFFSTGVAPYSVSIDTQDMAVGEHILGVHAQILQVDKSLGWGIFQYKLEVVASDADLPSDAGGGSSVAPATITDSVD